MSGIGKRLSWAPKRLSELLVHYGIPGGSVAVWYDGEEFATAKGMANVRARIEATPDTLFLIGSNTKVYTTTLIMQLVERGEVALDVPVREYVPELRLSDQAATEMVTVRHLLTHTSGITGDYFPDFGRGDDAVEKLVASLSDVEMLYQPGAMFSYCNSGFILVGRLIERVTGDIWDDVLRREILGPLGSNAFATLPEEAILHRVGVGHTLDEDLGMLIPGEMWPEVRSGGPAGFTPFATASDLVRFARLHLSGGRTPDGARLLTQESVAAMQAREVDSIPSGPFDSDGWGLGWARYRYGESEPVIGHNGGASAVLRVLPERNFAVASLTNASGGMYAGHHLIDAIIDELFSLRIPSSGDVSGQPFDPARCLGDYRHQKRIHHVTLRDGTLQTMIAGDQSSPSTLEPIDRTEFLVRTPGVDIPARASFLGDTGDGRARYLHIGGRAHIRDTRAD